MKARSHTYLAVVMTSIIRDGSKESHTPCSCHAFLLQSKVWSGRQSEQRELCFLNWPRETYGDHSCPHIRRCEHPLLYYIAKYIPAVKMVYCGFGTGLWFLVFQHIAACEAMNGCLMCLAQQHPMVKFCKIRASDAKLSFNFVSSISCWLKVFSLSLKIAAQWF